VKINFRSDLFNIYCDIVERKFELFETLTDIDDRAIHENLKIIENLLKIESLTEVDVRARNDNSSRG
jgi:hypothetical protein